MNPRTSIALAITTFLSTGSTLLAAEIAFTESNGQLFTIDTNSGIYEILGPTGSDVRFGSLVLAPNGQLYGIGSVFPEPESLFLIDTVSGNATPIGTLDLASVTGFAIDALGQFWASQDDVLYSIDPSLPSAAQVATLDYSINSLAARGRELYAVTINGDILRVDLVNTSTGQLDTVVLADAGPILGLPTDASFDPSGALRFVTLGGGPLAIVPHGFYRVDLGAAVVEETAYGGYFFTDPIAYMEGLALYGGAAPLTIPTLDHWALLLLISVLALVMLSQSRRRTREAP